MSSNPYEAPDHATSPNAVPQQSVPEQQTRTHAGSNVRRALIIFLLPALYNFFCFNFLLSPVFDEDPGSIPLLLYRVANAAGLIILLAIIWFLGLSTLELATELLNALTGQRSRLTEWKQELYRTLKRLPLFAKIGAVLWVFWTTAFYQLGVDFYLISVPVGIAAHVLAAALYLPLFYSWYRVSQ